MLDELLCSVELLEGDTALRDVINKHISDQTQVSPGGRDSLNQCSVFIFFIKSQTNKMDLI